MKLFLLISLTLFFIIAPYYLRKISHKIHLTAILSDVVICFIIGIILGNAQSSWMPNSIYQKAAFSIAETITTISVLFAIPMLLMVSDIRSFLRYAPKFSLSFLLCIIAVLLATFLSIYLFPDLPFLGQTAGSMVGVYIGGTPNMVAINYALGTPNKLFVILNSTDLFCSGIFFLFLTSFAKRFYGLFLPTTPSIIKTAQTANQTLPLEHSVPLNKTPKATKFLPDSLQKRRLFPILQAISLAIVCISFSVFIAFVFPTTDGNLNELLLMVVLSTISISLSFFSRIRSLKGVYEFAQYLLLIFAVAVGFMVNFSALAAAPAYLVFNAILVISLLVLHLIFAMIFKIDTDTFIITATACIFGPPFIGQVCSAIKNKEMLAPGIAFGVLGLIIGTYLGIFVASLIGYS